jgi:TonB-dependent starch-binding outer membrane protein SusC
MLNHRAATTLSAGAVFLVLAGCGGPGLPPGGPEPGEVDIGYDTQPADQVTGAVSSITGADATDTRSARIDELLRGRVAGLQIIPRPDGGYSFRIRGLDTIDQNPPEPLFVVDGVQVRSDDIDSALSGLTRQDIRQVDVLRDIASTSIYGQRGVGGVVIISTRRR